MTVGTRDWARSELTSAHAVGLHGVLNGGSGLGVARLCGMHVVWELSLASTSADSGSI